MSHKRYFYISWPQSKNGYIQFIINPKYTTSNLKIYQFKNAKC